jgi:hypothetical protein
VFEVVFDLLVRLHVECATEVHSSSVMAVRLLHYLRIPHQPGT